MHISFVIHGKLRKIGTLKKSIQKVFGNDFKLSFYLTKKNYRTSKLVYSLIKKGVDFVIIAGGDGSVNEAVNGYMAAEGKRKKVTLGVLPLGTGNDFARSLEVSADLNKLKALIQNNSVKKVDICRMYYKGLGDENESRFFINIADIGLGGYVIQKVRTSSKILGSGLTYVMAIISSFLTYTKQSITLKGPEYNWEGKMLSLCMANGKYFGSGMCIAPDAQLTDGLIQLTIFGDVSLWDYIRNISRIKRGEKIVHEEVTYTTVRKLSIVSNGNPCPIDMDGEFVGHTPLDVEIVPQSVKMIVNQEYPKA